MKRGARAAAAATLFLAATDAASQVRSVLDAAGTDSRETAALWWQTSTILTVVYVLFGAILLWSLVRARRAKAADVGTDGRLRTAVTVSALFTAGVLTVFLVTSFAVERAISALGEQSPALEIEVTGRQWWWEVEYPNAAPDRVVTTANEIHVPLDTPVRIRLTSADVIHSFWVPSLGGKMDLIPGRGNSLWLRAERAGRYAGQCAEFCGLQHTNMGFFVVAESKEAFDAWLEAERAPAVEPATDVARKGRDLFVSGPCALCHTVRGTDAGGRNAPDLTHVASRSTIAAASFPNDRDHLAPWVLDAQALKPGSNMPVLAMGGGELEAIVAYLESLR